MRQALAGMLWSKQFYLFDLDYWLQEHNSNPLRGGAGTTRNREWYHMLNEHIISMPDKWEYPWFAAWDLAFHTIALSLVDTDFAQDQLNPGFVSRSLQATTAATPAAALLVAEELTRLRAVLANDVADALKITVQFEETDGD